MRQNRRFEAHWVDVQLGARQVRPGSTLFVARLHSPMRAIDSWGPRRVVVSQNRRFEAHRVDVLLGARRVGPASTLFVARLHSPMRAIDSWSPRRVVVSQNRRFEAHILELQSAQAQRGARTSWTLVLTPAVARPHSPCTRTCDCGCQLSRIANISVWRLIGPSARVARFDFGR